MLAEPFTFTFTFTDATFTQGATFGGARFEAWAGFSPGQFTWAGTFAGATFQHGVPAEAPKAE